MGLIPFSELADHLAHYGIRLVSMDASQQQRNYPVLPSSNLGHVSLTLKLKLQYLKKTAIALREAGVLSAPADTVAWYIQATILNVAVSPIQLNLGQDVCAIPKDMAWTLSDPKVYDIDLVLQVLQTIPMDFPALDDIRIPEEVADDHLGENHDYYKSTKAPIQKPPIRRPKKWI